MKNKLIIIIISVIGGLLIGCGITYLIMNAFLSDAACGQINNNDSTDKTYEQINNNDSTDEQGENDVDNLDDFKWEDLEAVDSVIDTSNYEMNPIDLINATNVDLGNYTGEMYKSDISNNFKTAFVLNEIISKNYNAIVYDNSKYFYFDDNLIIYFKISKTMLNSLANLYFVDYDVPGDSYEINVENAYINFTHLKCDADYCYVNGKFYGINSGPVNYYVSYIQNVKYDDNVNYTVVSAYVYCTEYNNGENDKYSLYNKKDGNVIKKNITNVSMSELYSSVKSSGEKHVYTFNYDNQLVSIE